MEWSLRTFGPGMRTNGITKHIEKELAEIRANPLDLLEWVDVIILGLDGAWRCMYYGHRRKLYVLENVFHAMHSKAYTNKVLRNWPEPQPDVDEPVEHIREP